MKIFDAEATRQALPFRPLVDALARMFVTGCEVPLRHTHAVQADDGSAGTVLIMPAWRSADYLGIKTVNVFPGNAQRGLSGLFATYVLYDVHTGEPLALIDGNEITSRRTAAASALAASKLARPDARRLLVVGAGRVASLLPEAYCAVLPIDEIAIWARRPEAAEALADAEVQKKLEGVGTFAAWQSPEQLAERMRADHERWGEVIRENNITRD